jgi:carboxymethylenebutenolidase
MTTRLVLEGATPLQIAGDPGAPRALIVLQEAFGVNDHIRSVTEMFASRGFYAVAPELFHRAGSPEVPYDNFPEAMAALGTLSHDGLRDDLVASARFLNGAGYETSSIGIVGYCMGGSVAFFGATLGIVGAAVSYYGGGVENGRFGLPSLLELAPSLRCAWLGLYGDLDKGIPVEQVEALRAATAATDVSTEIVRYPDAEHGFNCDGRPAVFNSEASRDATRRTLEFFDITLRAK